VEKEKSLISDEKKEKGRALKRRHMRQIATAHETEKPRETPWKEEENA